MANEKFYSNLDNKSSKSFHWERYYNNKIYNPYIIAEAGVNHEGKMNIAIDLINQAADGGANAIKFQTYKADKIASKKSPYYWDLKSENTKSQYLLFKKYDKFWKKECEK